MSRPDSSQWANVWFAFDYFDNLSNHAQAPISMGKADRARSVASTGSATFEMIEAPLTFPECANNFGAKLIEEKLSLIYDNPENQ